MTTVDVTAEIREKVVRIVAEQLGVGEDVSDDKHFVADLGADSLDTVELVMALEQAFEMEIPDEEAEKLKTIKDAVDYIVEHSEG